VIAYKEMRAIEAEINQRRGEPNLKSEIPLTNFRGIEIRHFAAEIARLALTIAEYQCNVLYLGQQQAELLFLPLKADNWITCGNALRLDWLSLCPPTGTGVTVQRQDLDLWGETEDQAEIDFENEGGETYICGNPPYKGSQWQTIEQKEDLEFVFEGKTNKWKSLDYVAGWFMKAADYGVQTRSAAAFVATNSICQGQQVSILWPLILVTGHKIVFGYTSFKWANLASHNAGVTVVIVGISNQLNLTKRRYNIDENGETTLRVCENINGYLVVASDIEIKLLTKPNDDRAIMQFGNHTYYGVDLLLTRTEANEIIRNWPESKKFLREFLGSKEVISGLPRKCLWIKESEVEKVAKIPPITQRLQKVAQARAKKKQDNSALKLANTPYKFREDFVGQHHVVVMPAISSENRLYLPVTTVNKEFIVGHKCYALYDAPLWNMALIASRLHWVWIGTVCVRMRTDFSYSNTLGWNTFPVPILTEQNKIDLTRCAENILLTREQYFPATIADMYDPDRMDKEFPLVREAHEHNDEVLERIYIGRRFKNDTERLEKLFDMYTKMTASSKKKTSKGKK
jgi:hypothetical protein